MNIDTTQIENRTIIKSMIAGCGKSYLSKQIAIINGMKTVILVDNNALVQ